MNVFIVVRGEDHEGYTIVSVHRQWLSAVTAVHRECFKTQLEARSAVAVGDVVNSWTCTASIDGQDYCFERSVDYVRIMAWRIAP